MGITENDNREPEYTDDMLTMHHAPIKRLSRPEAPRGFRVTERDIEILKLVARFRFLNSAQVVKFLGTNSGRILRRLQGLYAHGLLDRPVSQHLQLAALYNPPLTYGLGRLGAKLLAELGTRIDPALDWTWKNSQSTAPFLAHTLDVAEAVCAFEHACRAGDARLIDHHELLPLMPEKTRELRDPFKLRVSLRSGLKTPLALAVIPDRLFSVALTDQTRHNFALELDRSTMPITTKRKTDRSSYAQKIAGYFHSWREKKHTDTWGFQNFRILTITPSEKRIENMLAAQRSITGGSAPGLFLYSTPERIAHHGAFDSWTNGKGEIISLLKKV